MFLGHKLQENKSLSLPASNKKVDIVVGPGHTTRIPSCYVPIQVLQTNLPPPKEASTQEFAQWFTI
jgi:hypothetical protein